MCYCIAQVKLRKFQKHMDFGSAGGGYEKKTMKMKWRW